MRQLPSLHALRFFEAAARHGSFTRAAQELNVRQPAVSRQIAELEADLGAALFTRTKPFLTLTPEGHQLRRAVEAGFSQIAQTAKTLRRRARGARLVVNVSIGIASCWLLARIAEFHRRCPETDLQLVTRDANADFDPAEADVVVVFGEGGRPGYDSELIFAEELFAACSAGYLPGDRMLSSDELAGETLLHLDNPDHHDDWRRFLGPDAPQPRPGASFNSFIVYLHAALHGDGIALGWRRLMDDHLTAGTLRQACSRTVRTRRGYYCCLTESAMQRPEALAFRDWITGLAQ